MQLHIIFVYPLSTNPIDNILAGPEKKMRISVCEPDPYKTYNRQPKITFSVNSLSFVFFLLAHSPACQPASVCHSTKCAGEIYNELNYVVSFYTHYALYMQE